MHSLMRSIYRSYFLLNRKRDLNQYWRVIDASVYPEAIHWLRTATHKDRYLLFAWFHGFLRDKQFTTVQEAINKQHRKKVNGYK